MQTNVTQRHIQLDVLLLHRQTNKQTDTHREREHAQMRVCTLLSTEREGEGAKLPGSARFGVYVLLNNATFVSLQTRSGHCWLIVYRPVEKGSTCTLSERCWRRAVFGP